MSISKNNHNQSIQLPDSYIISQEFIKTSMNQDFEYYHTFKSPLSIISKPLSCIIDLSRIGIYMIQSEDKDENDLSSSSEYGLNKANSEIKVLCTPSKIQLPITASSNEKISGSATVTMKKNGDDKMLVSSNSLNILGKWNLKFNSKVNKTNHNQLTDSNIKTNKKIEKIPKGKPLLTEMSSFILKDQVSNEKIKGKIKKNSIFDKLIKLKLVRNESFNNKKKEGN